MVEFRYDKSCRVEILCHHSHYDMALAAFQRGLSITCQGFRRINMLIDDMAVNKMMTLTYKWLSKEQAEDAFEIARILLKRKGVEASIKY